MKILFATGNKHKVSEANRVGVEYGVEFIQVDCPYPEKRSESLLEIAEEGARFAYDKLKKPVIVEDSGLFIQALDGFPGTYSAYVFKKLGNYGILKLLENTENRWGEFRSVIAYCKEETLKSFEGIVEGGIADRPHGKEGFGYDPIFIPRGHTKTFAEDPEYKEKVSHRRKAVEGFIKWFTREKRP